MMLTVITNEKLTGRRRGLPASARVRSDAGFGASPHLVEAERLARHFIGQLEVGDHAFPDLRESFAEWCDEAGITPVSDTALGRWLRAAGLDKCRSGRRRVTVYCKRKPKSAARFAA